MFAGAAREAVFSRPDVIRCVNADFIPVALKAALVNNPPADEEGLLYREIARSKIAPQGLCVVNSAGKVLNWTLMFDEDRSLLAFLQHAKKRFARYPDAKRPVAAERHMRFPSQPLNDVKDSGKVLPVLDRHPKGKHCPAEPPLRKGTVVARLIGRALDRDGKPVADTVRQENYVEDRFHIGVETQQRLTRALADPAAHRVKVPIEVARSWVKQAYLGVLDVQPLDNPIGTRGDLKKCEFWAEPVKQSGGPALWRVAGESHVFIDRMANGGPGDMHEVKLTWQGFVEIKEKRITRLLLAARGAEKLTFGSARGKVENEVAILPGGHRIDMAGDVRFGIIGEPVAPAQASDDAPVPGLDLPPGQVPEEARRQLTEALGGAFVVFRGKVQEALKLSAEQKKTLGTHLHEQIQNFRQFFQKLDDRKPEEREKALRTYREKAQTGLTAFLKETLKPEQFLRLRQVMLQREGLFALGNAEIMRELEITDKQRQQFVKVVEEMQRRIEPLIKEAQKGGKREEILPKVMKIRKEHEGRIEAILDDAQKTQWKKMLGKPLVLDD